MRIPDERFEHVLMFFRTACAKNNISNRATEALITLLENERDEMCEGPELKKIDTLLESLEQNKKFDELICIFFTAMTKNPELSKSEYLTLPEKKNELIARVTKILVCNSSDDLSLDQSLLQNIPVNSSSPLFIIAEVFRDTLIEVGVKEEAAETARKAFLAQKMT